MEEITHVELAGSWSGSLAAAAALMAFCIAAVSSVEPLHAAPYCPGVVVAKADLVGDEVGELTDNPMARPMPRAARTAATIPTRTMVLRRTVITRGSSSTTG